MQAELVKTQADLRKAKETMKKQEAQIKKLQSENLMYRQCYVLNEDKKPIKNEGSLDELNQEFSDFIKANKPNMLEKGLDNLQKELD